VWKNGVCMSVTRGNGLALLSHENLVSNRALLYLFLCIYVHLRFGSVLLLRMTEIAFSCNQHLG
jgi:hypothetical protein